VVAVSVKVADCANVAVDASTPIKQTRKVENMRKVNPLVVSIVLLRPARLMIGSSYDSGIMVQGSLVSCNVLQTAQLFAQH
jgi:hypothetical protein